MRRVTDADWPLEGWARVRQGAANGTSRRIMKSRKSMGVGNRSEQIRSSAHSGAGIFSGSDPAADGVAMATTAHE